MMKKRIFASILTAGMVVGMLCACSTTNSSTPAGSAAGDSGGTDKYTIRVACENSDSYPATLGLAVMKAYVESHTDGAVQVDIYSNGQLGGEEETLEQTAQGTIEMAVASFAPLATYDNNFELMDIPFVFSSYEQAWMVLDSHVGTDLMGTLESQGLKGLAYMENGFRQCTSSVGPINTMADFKNLKIRTMQNNNHMASFSALGANPTPVAFSELYMALSQKTVDAQENPIANVTDKKLYEVQKYLSLTNHIYDAMPLVCNLDYWNKLPAKYQTAVQAGAIYGMEYSRFCNEERESEILEFVAKQGMTVNEVTADARAEMAATAQPAVQAQVAKDLSQDTVTQYMNDVKNVLSDISKWQ